MNLAKGTRVRLIKPLQKSDEIGDIYTVKNADDTSITVIRSRKYDTENFLNVTFGIGVAGYCVSQQEFAEHFEVIGMEESKKKPDNKVIIGAFTEEQLDNLWKEADSYENFKEMLKLAAKEKDKPQKKREWTPWVRDPRSGYIYSVSHPIGQSAKVKVKLKDFVGVASCNPDDTWDLNLGIKLASARANVKWAKAEMDEADAEWHRARALCWRYSKSLDTLMRQIYGKAAK